MTDLIKTIDESFNFNNLTIRVVGTYETPWFVAKDICDILELSNITEALRNIPTKWRSSEILKCANGNGQNMNMLLISEPAVYKLIMRSNKPITQKFQEVVCEDILPTLRKKGEYKIQSIIDRNKELEEEKMRLEEDKKKLEDEKNKLEQEKNKEIKKLQNKVLVKQKRVVYDNRNFIYMVQDEFHKKDRIYIVGKAIDLTQRLSSYDKTRDHEVIYYRCCNSAQQMAYIEKCVLSKLDKYREVSNKDRFILPEDECISLFTDVIDLFVNCFSDVDSSVDIEKNLTKDEIKMKNKETKKEYIEDNRESIEECRRAYYEEHKDELFHYHHQYRIDNCDALREKRSKFYNDNKEQIINFNKVYQENNKERIEEYQQQYRQDNNDALKTYNKEYYQENKEELDEANKNYRDEHREEMKEYNKEYYEENKEEFKKYKKEQYEKNKEAIIEESKKYYQENKEHVLDRVKEHYKNNKDKILDYQKEKIICECGMKIQRNYSAKHKKTKIHKISLENKLKSAPVQTKFTCECGREVGVSYEKRHMNSKIHRIAMELQSKPKTGECI